MQTRDEFIEEYCRVAKITREQFAARRVAMHCTCEDGKEIPHWAAIQRCNVRDHLEQEQVLASLRTND